LVVGTRVVLHSLRTIELNGAQGVFMAWDASALRCKVQLGESKESKMISVKPESVGLLEANLQVGMQVTLHSLKAAELNGSKGTCLSWDASSGRWSVLLQHRTVSVRPLNLFVAHASTSPSAGTTVPSAATISAAPAIAPRHSNTPKRAASAAAGTRKRARKPRGQSESESEDEDEESSEEEGEGGLATHGSTETLQSDHAWVGRTGNVWYGTRLFSFRVVGWCAAHLAWPVL
jgi:hypothetical protein